MGAIQTNTIEGFWSIFKRGIMDSFDKVSRKHLPLYVAQSQFRYINRENANIFAARYSRVLRHVYWRLPQEPKTDASEPVQLELAFALFPSIPAAKDKPKRSSRSDKRGLTKGG